MSAPRFLADEDLRLEIVLAARRQEPAICFLTTAEIGRRRSSDEVLLEWAADHGFIIVSHDVNTMSAYAHHRVRAGLAMAGLCLVAQFRSTREIVDSLILIANASTAEEWIGRVAYLPL